MLNNSKFQNRLLVAFLGGASLAALSIAAPALAQTLSGAQTVTQTFSAADLNVATDATFSVTTLTGNAIDLTSTNSLIFTDNYQSVINGGSNGIFAENNGSGALSITSTGTVGASGVGIDAYNSGTNLTVTSNNVTGSIYGIYADNFGTGALSITSTGTATATRYYGIFAENYGTNLTVTSNNATGRSTGILAENYGTGALSITSTGTVTGSGVYGIYAYNSSRGTNLTLTSNNATGGAYGIRAYNSGTGALSITSTGTATVTGANGFGISAENRSTGTNLTLTSNNVTGGGYGILAYNYGTGALSITSTGTVAGTGTNGYGIYAYNSSTGTNLTVTSNNVTGGGYGILAYNFGTGALSLTSTGTATGANGYGIFARNTSAGTNLTVTSNNVTGGLYGLYADNQGTGALSITSTGTVAGTGTNGIGIYALNRSTTGTNLTVTSNNATGVDWGIRALNLGTGALSITSTGTATGTGVLGEGISATNLGTNLTVTANNTTGGLSGIIAYNGGTGALSITSTGTATSTGDLGHGIFATNSGTDLTVTANNATGSIHGIYAENLGTGALSITSTGTATATGVFGYGIFALNKTRAISLTVSGTVTGGSYSDGYGDAAAGVDAVAGISVNSGSGSTAINLLSTAVVSAASGRAITASGNTTITFNAGSVVTGAVGFNGNLTLNTLTGSAQTLTRLIELSSDIVGLPDYKIGTVTKSGTGTLTLTGTNTYTGGTTISAGTLSLSGTGSIANSSSLMVNGNFDVSAITSHYSTVASLSGTGTVALGSKTLVLSAAAGTFSGVISGSADPGTGGVSIEAGTETLSGVNTFNGLTGISSGAKLALSGQGSVSSSYMINANGTFDVSAITGGTTSVNMLYGSGSVVLGAKNLNISKSTSVFTGTISGAGSISITKLPTYDSNTTVTLTGINTYTGGTTIGSGTNLYLGQNETTSTGSIVGDVVINDGGNLAFNRFSANAFGGVISGSGGVYQMGSGTTTLTGTNTYTGKTFLQYATLALSGSGSIAASYVYTYGGTFDISATTSGASIKSLQSDQNIKGTVTLGSKTLTLTAAADTFHGVISGTGGLNISGGYETLAGANTYTGGTTISAGTLQIGSGGTSGSIAGNVTNNATLAFNRSDSVTFAGIVSGTGALTKSGAGTLTLTGANTYTGGTTISAGTLQIGSGSTTGSISGNVTNNAAIAFNRSDSVTFAGIVSGTGALTKSGAGTTILTAANTYSGGTTVSAGTLQIGSGSTTGSISGNVTNNATLAFNRSDSVTFAGIVSGTGALTQSGTGTLTLTGANTYTGGTTVSGGTLSLGSNSAAGTGTITTTGSVVDYANGITVANAIVINSNTTQLQTLAGVSATQSGVISETGGARPLEKIGTGTLTLTGTNTYTGGTTISAGTLAVTGKIGAVTVTSGTLQGTGTVGTTTIASGSTLSPGINGAPGTLNVSGNLTMASGSNYAVAVTPTAASKAIVSGSANVNGAVTASFAAGNYTVGQKFAIFESTGLVTGSFASLTNAGAALPFYLTDNLSYTSNSVYLNLATKNLTPLLPTGSASNLTNTAKAIDGFVTAGGIPNTGMLALYSQTGAALADSITQAEGQVGANVATAVSQSFAPFLKAMTDQCATGSDQDASASCVWSSVYGGHTGISADVTTGAASLSGSNVGLAVGGQINLAEIDSVLAASMAIGQQSFSSGNGTGTSRDVLLGIYAHKSIMDHGYVSASLGYGNLDVTTTRTVTVAGTDVLSGNVTANEFGGRVEGGYRFNVEDQYGLTPYLAGSLQNINTPAYAETVQRGTSSYTLSYLSQNNTLSYFEAGTHLDRSFQLDDDTNLTAQGTIGWSHQLGYNPTSTVSFQSLIGSSFKLSGIKPANDMAVIGLNLQAQKATGLSFGVRLDSQVGSGTTILQGTGNVAYRW